MSAPSIVRGASLAPAPWKNGGGVTREIAVWPRGASTQTFVWRLSMADVASDGAFSRFDGIDRVLVLLDGAGMRLTEASGRTRELSEPLAMTHFPGETPIDATLLRGPIRDFNVMVRRDAARASVEARRGRAAFSVSDGIGFIFCAAGRLAIALPDGTRVVLESGDALRVESATDLICDAPDDTCWLDVRIALI